MKSLRLLKYIHQAKREEAANAKATEGRKRMDTSLPLGVKLGGMIGVSETPFFLAKDLGVAARCPPNMREVVAYGRMPIPGGMKMHRFYLDGDEGFILRVITDEKNQVVDEETALFVKSEEHSPTKKKEWNAWLGNPEKPKKPYLIGFETFTIGDDEEDDDSMYFRLIEDDDASEEDENYLQKPQILPIGGVERLFSDPYDLIGESIDRKLMFYGRTLGEPGEEINELCTVSSVATRDEAWIEVLTALPVSKEDLTIL